MSKNYPYKIPLMLRSYNLHTNLFYYTKKNYIHTILSGYIQYLPDGIKRFPAVSHRFFPFVDIKTDGKRFAPELYGQRDYTYPAMSDAVSVGYSEAEGRHATASRDVPVGRVLLTERAYASVLLREYCSSHCTNCFAK